VSRVRWVAALGGAALLLAGVLGFVPGVTTHYGDLRLGRGSQAELFGVFRVSILLNLVHIVLGAAGIVVARARAVALVSLALWLLGVAGAGARIPLDTADNWLHFVLGLALIALARTALTAPRPAAHA